MALRSLRGRVVVGSLIWGGGLLATATVIAAAIVHRYPRWTLFLHNSLVTLAALIVLVIGILQFRRGLAPLDALRRRLAAVRDGHARRVDGDYPSEVQPLVDDLNALLDDRERRVVRAVARAGDLAHGLKTPLAILAQESAAAAAAGQPDLAAVIDEQVARMRRQVDSHLAHARASASGAGPAARTAVRPAADGLVRTMQRLYASRPLGLMLDVPNDHVARVDRADLEEMLGNLIDNACKWARTQVRVVSKTDGAFVAIDVEDDGPGIATTLREAVLQRGVRADEAAPGSGWGLAIVRDLAEAYGGSVALDTSPLGGLRATLLLPKG